MLEKKLVNTFWVLLQKIEFVLKFPKHGCSVSFLIDEKLESDFHLGRDDIVIENSRNNRYKLSADFSNIQNNTISVQRLLGIDVNKQTYGTNDIDWLCERR